MVRQFHDAPRDSPNMQINPESSSAWMTEFAQHHRRGKHLLLYGNIVDQYLLNGEYLSLLEFLGRYFKAQGYELIGRYDFVDGLQLAEPVEMEPRFEQILRSSLGGDPNPPPSPPPDPGGESELGAFHPPRRVPRAAGASLTGSLRPPDQALAAIRAVIGQTTVASTMIVNFCDLLTGQPDHLSEAERGILVQLRKTIHNAGYLRTGRLAGSPNRLVLSNT